MKRPKREKLEGYILRHYGGKGATKQSCFSVFAEAVSVSPAEVRKWIDGDRTPRDEKKRLIQEMTKGLRRWQITLYDW